MVMVEDNQRKRLREKKEVWWEGSVTRGIVERVARLCDGVKPVVEVGVHLCYGEFDRAGRVACAGLGTDDFGRRERREHWSKKCVGRC